MCFDVSLQHGSVPLSDLGVSGLFEEDDNDVATKFVPNNLTRTKRMTELDLALMNHHMVSIGACHRFTNKNIVPLDVFQN